jgi:hypothetical protein
MNEYTTITLGNGYDVTVTPTNVATVWKGDKPARTLEPVNITYDYGVGDRNQYTARRSGSDAVEFIICSWIHGRHIINVEFA